MEDLDQIFSVSYPVYSNSRKTGSRLQEICLCCTQAVNKGCLHSQTHVEEFWGVFANEWVFFKLHMNILKHIKNELNV